MLNDPHSLWGKGGFTKAMDGQQKIASCVHYLAYEWLFGRIRFTAGIIPANYSQDLKFAFSFTLEVEQLSQILSWTLADKTFGWKTSSLMSIKNSLMKRNKQTIKLLFLIIYHLKQMRFQFSKIAMYGRLMSFYSPLACMGYAQSNFAKKNKSQSHFIGIAYK